MKKTFFLALTVIMSVFAFAQPSTEPCQPPTEGPEIGAVFRSPIGNIVALEGKHIVRFSMTGQNYQKGAIWSKEKLDFSKNFILDSYLFFDTAENAADGITLTFQNDKRMETSPGLVIGSTGASLGAYGYPDPHMPSINDWVERAISLEVDIFGNQKGDFVIDKEIGEPAEGATPGHLAFVTPKPKNNNPKGEHSGITKASADNKLANGCWRKFRVIWSAATKTYL